MLAVASKVFCTLLDPRVIGALSVAVLVWAGWSHYTGLRNDLATARSDLAATTTRAETAERLARDNAAAALKAAADRRLVVEALEATQRELAENSTSARAEEAEVQAAPDTDDGPVAPLLETLRQRRFQ